MNDSTLPPLPEKIRRRDGQIVSFEPHQISQSLFAASAELGQPNAFLARELTDSVMHFLGQEAGATVPTTDQLAELIEKVVRELGQPALAQAYGARRRRVAGPTVQEPFAWESRFPASVTPQQVVRASLEAFSLQAVYSPDLASAHREGLLTLTDLDQPASLYGAVAEAFDRGPLGDAAWLRLVLEKRALAGRWLVVDGPDHWLQGNDPEDIQRCLGGPCRHWHDQPPRRVVLHLNTRAPPRGETARGPLFSAEEEKSCPGTQPASAWMDVFLSLPPSMVEIVWHLETATNGASPPQWFTTFLTQAGALRAVRFVLARRGRSVRFGDGLHRGHAGILGVVGLNLSRLASWPGVDGDAAKFLAKLPSLARMGVAAGVQRRQYLRRQPHLQGGFITERCPWYVVPIGLEAVVQSFLGASMAASPASLDFGVRVVTALRASLAQEARPAHLEVSLGGCSFVDLSPVAGDVWGVTPWDYASPWPQQLHAAAALQEAAGGGSACVFLPHRDPGFSPTKLWQSLHAKSELDCVGFLTSPLPAAR